MSHMPQIKLLILKKKIDINKKAAQIEALTSYLGDASQWCMSAGDFSPPSAPGGGRMEASSFPRWLDTCLL